MTPGRIDRILRLLVAALLLGCGGGGGGGEDPPDPGGGGPQASLALFAGHLSVEGQDGDLVSADIGDVRGIARDAAGNLYLADSDYHNIRKITPSGAVSTLAGAAGVFGSADGVGRAARFRFPEGIAVDGAGHVYVADTANHVIRKITPEGSVSTLAGMALQYGSADGIGPQARFDGPRGVAAAKDGNVYVIDAASRVRKITPDGSVTTVYEDLVGKPGCHPGALLGIATDGASNVYLVGESTQVLKITPDGVVSEFSGSCMGLFRWYAVVSDAEGNLIVRARGVDNNFAKVTPDGQMSPPAAGGGVYGYSFAVDTSGTHFLAAGAQIYTFTAEGLMTPLMGSANKRDLSPFGIAVDAEGQVFVADGSNESNIRKITPAGEVSRFTPVLFQTESGDHYGLGSAKALAVDSAGNLYVSSAYSGTADGSIRKVTPTGAVSTFAGQWYPTYGGEPDLGFVGGGDTTPFNQPYGVAVDAAGTVYVADTGNHVIRKITAEAVISTLAGTMARAGSADGAGSEASFDSPHGLALDGAGNLYVADANSSTIRKITPEGVVSTLAGKARIVGSVDGVGPAARFKHPLGLAADPAGNVYVADTGNSTVRKITPAGVVSTIVGVPGQAWFSPGPLPGTIINPQAVAVSGNLLYILSKNGVAVVQNVP